MVEKEEKDKDINNRRSADNRSETEIDPTIARTLSKPAAMLLTQKDSQYVAKKRHKGRNIRGRAQPLRSPLKARQPSQDSIGNFSIDSGSERGRLTSMYAYARKGQFAIPDDVTFVSRVPSVASIEVAVGNIQRSVSMISDIEGLPDVS
jgi:hypothetical protein